MLYQSALCIAMHFVVLNATDHYVRSPASTGYNMSSKSGIVLCYNYNIIKLTYLTFVRTTQAIGWERRVQNDLFCVQEWNVKRYTLQKSAPKLGAEKNFRRRFFVPDAKTNLQLCKTAIMCFLRD